jgi:hypothetical protein
LQKRAGQKENEKRKERVRTYIAAFAAAADCVSTDSITA